MVNPVTTRTNIPLPAQVTILTSELDGMMVDTVGSTPPQDPFAFLQDENFDWEIDLYSTLLKSFFENDTRSAPDFMCQFSTSQGLIKLLKAFNKVLTSKDSNIPPLAKCWSLLSTCETALFDQMVPLLNSLPKDNLSDGLPQPYKSYLEKFNRIGIECTLLLANHISSVNQNTELLPSLVLKRFPVYNKDLNDLPLEISPFVILLVSSKEQLLSKPSNVTWQDWLSSMGNKLIQDMITLEGGKNKNVYHCIALLNSCFSPFKDFSHDHNHCPCQLLQDSIPPLIKFIRHPFVFSLIRYYQKDIISDIYELMSGLTCGKLYDCCLDLVFEVYRNTGTLTPDITSFKKVANTNDRFTIVCRNHGDRMLEHESGDGYMIIYVNENLPFDDLLNWLTIYHPRTGTIQLPCDLVFGFSHSIKRKRPTDSEDSIKRIKTSESSTASKGKHVNDDPPDTTTQKDANKSSVENSYRIIPPLLLKLFSKKVGKWCLTGVPKRQWHNEELVQIVKNLDNELKLALPLECVYSPASKIRLDTIQDIHKISLTLMIENIPDELERQNKILGYLNGIDMKIQIKLHPGTDLKKVFNFSLGLIRHVKLEYENYTLPPQFDLSAFLAVLTKVKTKLQNQFLHCIFQKQPNNFTMEQIELLFRLPAFRKGQFGNFDKVFQTIVASFKSDPNGESLYKLLALPEVRFLANTLISKLLQEHSSTLAGQDPNYTKKLIRLLCTQALEAVAESPPPTLSLQGEDPQQYLLDALQKVPLLIETYPAYVISIFMDLLELNSKSLCAAEILDYLLKNENTNKTFVNRIGGIYKASNLVVLLSQDKNKLPLYPEFMIRVFNNSLDFKIDSQSEFFKLWDKFFMFLLNKKLLQTPINIIDFFNSYFEIVMPHKDEAELEKICQFLVPMANTLSASIVIKYGSGPLKNKCKKVIDLFLKYNWVPGDETKKISHFFISALCRSLPHLNGWKLKWLEHIITNFAVDCPVLDDLEQEELSKLIDFYCIQRCHQFPILPADGLKSYPIVTKHLLDQLRNKNSTILPRLQVYKYMELFTLLLSVLEKDKRLTEAETCDYIFGLIKIVEPSVRDSFISIDTTFKLFSSLSNNLQTMETILSKACIVSSKRGKTEVLFLSGYFASKIMYTAKSPLKPETLKLCAQAGTHRATFPFYINLSKIPDHSNRERIEEILWQVIKESDEKLVRPLNILQFWQKFLAKYHSSCATISSEQAYNQLLDNCVILVNSVLKANLQLNSDLFKSIFFPTKSSNPPNLIKDSIERILSSERFWKEIKSYNKNGLTAVIKSLPLLDEESQKACYQLIQHHEIKFSSKWLSTQPVLYNKLINKSIKRGGRNDKMLLLLYPCQNPNFEKIVELTRQLAPLSFLEFYCCSRVYGDQLSKCLGRELTEQEKSWKKLSCYELSPTHGAAVRSFIEMPNVPPIDSRAADLSSLLGVFDLINFEDKEALNYLNPSFLKIDNKKVAPQDARGFIHQLIENFNHNKMIEGAPSDDVERKKRYEELRVYLTHIVHIMAHLNPVHCSGYFLALAEIGSKCFTQYPELPALYHTMKQHDMPLVPAWIQWKPNHFYETYPFENTERFGYVDRRALIQDLRSFFSGIYSRNLDFEKPLLSTEIPYTYSYMIKNITAIAFLIQQLPSSIGTGLLAKVARLNRKSAEELIKECEMLKKELSVVWLIPYSVNMKCQHAHLNTIVHTIIANTLNGITSDVEPHLRKVVSVFYGLTENQIKEILQKIVDAFEKPADFLKKISELSVSVDSLILMRQPKDLGERILIKLHEMRWKVFNDRMARLPEGIASNVHHAKYLKHEFSRSFSIYHSVPSQNVYHLDPHVDPAAKNAAGEIVSNFSGDYNVFSVLSFVKQMINTGEYYDWIIANLPEGKTIENIRECLLEDDYTTIKEEWILYFLVKTGIFKIDPVRMN